MYVCGLEHVRNLLSWTRDNLAEVTDILRAREDGRASEPASGQEGCGPPVHEFAQASQQPGCCLPRSSPLSVVRIVSSSPQPLSSGRR